MKKIPGAYFPPFDNLEETPPAKTGCETPEYRRMDPPPPAPKPAEQASEYITISVAEYHFLTKLATMLEVILNADDYTQMHVVKATKKAVEEMTKVTTEITREYDNGTTIRTVTEE